FIFFFLLFLYRCLAVGYVFVYSGCSDEKYQPNATYEANLNSLLSGVAVSSSRTLYNAFAVGNDTSDVTGSACYGLFQCRSDLRARDCYACIAAVVAQVGLLCPYTVGAAVQLDGCFLRYEKTDFIGKLDTGLRYQKCSQSASNDADFSRKRDEVLADLLAAEGFKVSAAAAVEGYSQCLGDLSAQDCSSCLAEAVAEVKSFCGSAAAGDVFLSQCYARYWEAGYYGPSTSSSLNSSGQDYTGRTVAIIIGVVAGTAVLVVLLAICKKALH
ncbi:hypothetical protein M569_15470, partial [Genlisea aurea]